MMHTRIPLLIGQSDFAQFRQAGSYYEDMFNHHWFDPNISGMLLFSSFVLLLM